MFFSTALFQECDVIPAIIPSHILSNLHNLWHNNYLPPSVSVHFGCGVCISHRRIIAQQIIWHALADFSTSHPATTNALFTFGICVIYVLHQILILKIALPVRQCFRFADRCKFWNNVFIDGPPRSTRFFVVLSISSYFTIGFTVFLAISLWVLQDKYANPSTLHVSHKQWRIRRVIAIIRKDFWLARISFRAFSILNCMHFSIALHHSLRLSVYFCLLNIRHLLFALRYLFCKSPTNMTLVYVFPTDARSATSLFPAGPPRRTRLFDVLSAYVTSESGLQHCLARCL